MSEEPTARELNNAINSLANKFPSPVYRTIKLKDATCPFHLEVFRNSKEKGTEVFKFRIIFNEFTETDERLCKEYQMPGHVFTKFLACKKGGRNNFEYKEIS